MPNTTAPMNNMEFFQVRSSTLLAILIYLLMGILDHRPQSFSIYGQASYVSLAAIRGHCRRVSNAIRTLAIPLPRNEDIPTLP